MKGATKKGEEMKEQESERTGDDRDSVRGVKMETGELIKNSQISAFSLRGYRLMSDRKGELSFMRM